MGKSAKFIGLKSHMISGKCFLGVSYGPEYYKGESLEAIVQLIAKNFDAEHRVIMFAGGLYAYNLMIRDPTQLLTLEEARKVAIQESEQWLDSDDGRKLQTLGHVVHWQEIIEDPGFAKHKEYLHSLYLTKDERKKLEKDKENPEVKIKLSYSEAMDRAISEREATIKASMDEADFDAQRIRPLIRQYLEEEGAGELVIAEKWPYEHEAYPGERNSVASWIHSRIISKKHHGILKWLTIKISNTPQHANVSATSHSQTVSGEASSPPSQNITIAPQPALTFANSSGLFKTEAASFNMATLTPENLARYQKLLEEYTKEVNGKLLTYQRLLAIAGATSPKKLPRKFSDEDRKQISEACQLLDSLDKNKAQQTPSLTSTVDH